ncbi:large subunit ribosomal protein L7e [Strigomonas culicis]|uniref:Large subunit ribosomal protein L7e n=2 Tax=Strigomonas culicis TaxID=28005 RepID=S9UFL0_9TRYP|nr:large subunit ribosomal protein L7e [Strigomonas culicis]|eukprot:EPY29587.1 large subunit ribosomal protein L7e [Strigomonas culicis]
MGKNPPKWLPGERVKETILLQRKSVEQMKVDRLMRKDKLHEQRQKRKAKLDAKRKKKMSTKKFITAQTLLKHAERKIHQGRRFQKIGERADGRRLEADPETLRASLKDSKVVLIVRAKGKQIPPEVAAAFKALGLSKIYSARLLCLTTRTDKLVKQLTPFSIVGHPDKAQLEALLRTRGALYNEADHTRRVISGNLILEQTLGDFNVLCIEDLVEVIHTRGEGVEEVLRHVAPFDFHPPRQLFFERHRSAHQKMEQVNEESFTAYLAQQLKQTAKRARREEKKTTA